MPNLSEAKRVLYLPFLRSAMDEFDINTPLRAAAFLSQITYESAELRFLEEIWGPTAWQRGYEPPGAIARQLGNVHPGDGKRFRGRGALLIAGRANYQKYGQLLGIDLVSNPDLAASPQIAFRIACLFWNHRGFNALADQQEIMAITKGINAGLAGVEQRLQVYALAKRLLEAQTHGENKATDVSMENGGEEVQKIVRRSKKSKGSDDKKTSAKDVTKKPKTK